MAVESNFLGGNEFALLGSFTYLFLNQADMVHQKKVVLKSKTFYELNYRLWPINRIYAVDIDNKKKIRNSQRESRD